jgi:hypothetical protein
MPKKPSSPLKTLNCSINQVKEKGKSVLNVVQLKPRKPIVL